MSAAPRLRQGESISNKSSPEVIADTIREDRDSEYSDAFLGQSRDQYITKIQQEQTWGGGIGRIHDETAPLISTELAAFAK